MDYKAELLPYLIAWVVVIALLVVRSATGSKKGAGLVLSYCFQMWLLYWVGALFHCLPWTDLPQTDFTVFGFTQSTYALLSFAAGCLFIAPIFSGHLKPSSESFTPDRSLPRAYIIGGGIAYVVLLPIMGKLPSITALLAVGQQLVIVGCCLAAWTAWQNGGLPELTRSLVWLVLLPVVTIVSSGFLGYAVVAMSIVLIFVAQFFRPRWILLVTFLVVAYIGLSFFVCYMRNKVEIRAAVWGGQSFSERVDRLWETIKTVQWFDVENQEHLFYVDVRLNQNTLVGAAVVNLSNTGDFAKGETIKDAFLGLIPRVLWPNKPISGGSGNLVSRFTGIEFAEGTSVGIGPVMEFYANFGTMGVIFGFLLLGSIVGVIDRAAAIYLHQGNWASFSLWFLVGISFLQVGGSLVEVSTSAIASVILGRTINALRRRSRNTEQFVEQRQILSVRGQL
jgi:hypothetical protein